jgi:hypothetical protein
MAFSGFNSNYDTRLRIEIAIGIVFKTAMRFKEQHMKRNQQPKKESIREAEKASGEKVCSICQEPLGDGDAHDPFCTYCAAKLRAVFNDD